MARAFSNEDEFGLLEWYFSRDGVHEAFLQDFQATFPSVWELLQDAWCSNNNRGPTSQ